MKRHPRLLIMIVIALSGCGRGTSDSQGAIAAIEVSFGNTEFLWDSGDRANDYIREYPKVLREAASHCGLTLIGLNGAITDGGEAAYFHPGEQPDQVISCLEQQIPQGNVELIDAATWDDWRSHGWRPMPIPPASHYTSPPPA